MVAIKTVRGMFRPPHSRLFGNVAVLAGLADSQRLRSDRECGISMANLSSVSTGKLNTLPCLHIRPINQVVFLGTFAIAYET